MAPERGAPARDPATRGSTARVAPARGPATPPRGSATPARIQVTGRWYRITRPGTSPLFWSAVPFDARWQRGAVVRGLYLACCADTAWAEWLRATAEDGVPPASRLPRDVWPLDVDVDAIEDLSDPTSLKAFGLPRIRPSQRQWPAYQVVGEALWRGGARGLLAPSAAHEGHRVLCLFRPEPAVPGVIEVPPPSTYREIPVIPVGVRT